MDADEVVRSAGTDKKMAYVAQRFGHDFVVLETDGLDGHLNLKNYRMSKEVFSEGYVSFGVKKHSFLLEPSRELSQWILQVTNKPTRLLFPIHNIYTTFIRRYNSFYSCTWSCLYSKTILRLPNKK